MKLVWMVWTLATLTEGARILYFYPMPLKSHHSIFERLVRELAVKGHHITAVTPFPLSDPPPNYEEIVIDNVLEDISKNVKLPGESVLSYFPVIKDIVETNEWGVYLQRRVCSMKIIQDFIHSKREFDLIISESLMQEGFSALQHKFNALGVEIVPLAGYTMSGFMVGNTINPSYIPDAYSQYTDKMTFMQRVDNTLTKLAVISLGYLYMPKIQAIMDDCFNYSGWESRPSLKDLLSDKALVLENSHFSVGYPYPHSPHVIPIAGINIRPNNPLPKDIKDFMDGASEGVVYLSFGTLINVSEVTNRQKLDAFLNSFTKIKQRILLKWEVDELPSHPENVLISKWFPQQDILAHRNCRLFISHGGISSVTEAINYAVPLIGIPFFGEQLKNVKLTVSQGTGIYLDWSNVTEDSVSWALKEVLNNPSYGKRMQEMSAVFRDRLADPLDSAVYWVEYVLRYKGAKHLRPSSTRLHWWQSALIDVFLLLFGPIVIISYLVIKIATKKLCRFLCKKQIVKEKIN